MHRTVVAALITTLLVVAWATTGSVTAQVPACLPTSARTFGPHVFPGVPIAPPAKPVYTDAYQYALTYLPPVPAKAEAEILNGLGFVSATWQVYIGVKRKTLGDLGFADTEQLGSPEQAQAELDRGLAEFQRQERTKQFSVAAIPGSRGLREKPNKHHRNGDSFLYFTDGDYYYDVGREVRRGGSGTRQVIQAATAFYNRVHGAPACP